MSEPNAFMGIQTFFKIPEILDEKKAMYDYYKHNLPGTFQEVLHSHNYNTIGFLTDLQIPPHIEYRKYYEPLNPYFPITNEVYQKIVCLPSWYGVDYEKITEDIIQYNEKIKSGNIIRQFSKSEVSPL
jgi:dTDP-4-amino-4,6-dideoxygalactose transaminase